MAETIMELRMSVLRHFDHGDWSFGPGTFSRPFKGNAVLAWLRKKNLLEEDPGYLGMHKITNAGRNALARLEESM